MTIQKLMRQVVSDTDCPQCSAKKGQECVTVGGYFRDPHERRCKVSEKIVPDAPKYKKLVLLEYDNAGPFVQLVTSNRPLTLNRIANYFAAVDGANWERDSLTILSNGEIAEFSIDKRKKAC